MIRTSGGPLPTSRYPTVPTAVAATCADAEVTETVVALGCDEPQAPSAAVSVAAVSPAVIRRPQTAPTVCRFIAIPAFFVCRLHLNAGGARARDPPCGHPFPGYG